MIGLRSTTLVLLVVVLLLATPASADKLRRYPEAKHGKGELTYINGIPVLRVEGSPEEMGEQLGVLALTPSAPLTKLADEFIKKHGWEKVFSISLKTANVLRAQFPPDHLEELDAAARVSPGWSRDLLVFGNTITDLRRIIQCSTLVVEAGRSTTGGPLFGRNLDWPPFGPLHDYTFVVIHRPTGKRSFASITYPGLLGCASGINDAGLAIAALDVSSANDGSIKFNPFGIPSSLALRRVLEECTTIEEAEELLRSSPRASMLNVAICDKKRGAVVEITPKSVVVRPSVDGISICTNHFRTQGLVTSTKCWRYDVLGQSRALKKHTVADIAKRMHAVNQGTATLQAMIFEPGALKLHLAFGKGPATRLPMRTLDLARLFESGEKAP